MNAGKGTALITVTMVLGVLMDGIDGSIVNVALPAIAHGFGTDTSVVSWVTISYFLLMAGFLLPFGRIASAGHIRKVFLFGFAVFTIGSVACALSPTLSALIASRVVQGLGAAAIAAVAPMICVKVLPPEHLGRSLGIMSVAASMGFALGPALGGLIVEFLSWHWIFFINIPIGAAAMLIGSISLPKQEVEKVSVDMRGSVLLFVAVGFAVFALERMSYPDERLFCVLSGAAALVFVALFTVESLRSENPLLNVRLFRLRDMDLNLLSYTIVNLVYMGALYILPFYMDMELGLTSLQSGIVLLVPSLFSLVMCIPVGNYSDSHGRRVFSIMATVCGVAYSGVLFMISPEMGLIPLILTTVLMGVEWGLCGATSSGRIVDSIPDDEKAIGSSLMNFMIYMGSTVGTALFASMLTSGGDSAGIPIEEMTSEAFMSGMHLAMVGAIALSLVSVVCSVIANERKHRDEIRRMGRLPQDD